MGRERCCRLGLTERESVRREESPLALEEEARLRPMGINGEGFSFLTSGVLEDIVHQRQNSRSLTSKLW